MLDNVRADFKRYAGEKPTVRSAFYALTEVAWWALVTFRLGKAIQRIRPGIVRKPLTVFYFFLYKFMEIVSGVRISIDSEIGPGLQIHNFGGIIIHGRLGRGCTVVQGAQLVSRGDFKGRGWPTLGDEVYVGTGAKILGPVTIGNRVRIGANAVVRDDVPDDAVVLPPESTVVIRPRKADAGQSRQV